MPDHAANEATAPPLDDPDAEVDGLERLLVRLCETVDCGAGRGANETTTVEALLDRIGRRSYGPLLLALGLISISPVTIVPGMTWFMALLVLILAAQMAAGLKSPWMPARVLRTRVPAEPLVQGIEQARPWARRVDRIVKPRLCFLLRPPFVNCVALLCVAAALVTFPLGFIPFAPVAPGLAILFLGLGVAAKDGVFVGLGALAVLGAGLLVLRLVG